MQEHGAMQEDGDEAPSASGSPGTSGRPDGGAGPRSARYGSTWPSPRRVERGRSTERRSLPGCTCPAATVDASGVAQPAAAGRRETERRAGLPVGHRQPSPRPGASFKLSQDPRQKTLKNLSSAKGGKGLPVGALTAEPASWSLLQTLSRPS